MKLVIAVIHDEDSKTLMDALNQAGFQVTKLASTGGFLKLGNTTIFVGVEKEKVESVIKIIKDKCTTQKQMTIVNQSYANTPHSYVPYPIEVTTGGATVFVIDVENFLKL